MYVCCMCVRACICVGESVHSCINVCVLRVGVVEMVKYRIVHSILHSICTFHFASFLQAGWTAVLLAAHYGHKELVQELCETFGADFLHKMKVRVMQTI